MLLMEQEAEVKQAADLLLAQRPDWITFYREILGPNGVVRQVFPTRDAITIFEQSETYEEILRSLSRLREGATMPNEDAEPTRVITVRLPKSLHEALRIEAHEHRTSMNKLCISKLLQFIDGEKVPSE
ncbi:MAG: toxin-antitoxin system HicB family antitoxin [Planctomycetaceae bacterium]|nr:toxin-antitoxin system HicB family antitoxin [Planctomycetaceae bacterium]